MKRMVLVLLFTATMAYGQVELLQDGVSTQVGGAHTGGNE